MDKIKQYVTLAVLGAVVILAAGWFLLVSPKQGEATDLQAQADSQVSANAVLATQLQALKVQAKDLPKKQAELARVAAKIPDNPSLPALIRALTAASTKAGVEFVSVTPGPPAALTPAVGAAPVAPVAPGAAVVPSAGSAGGLAAIPVTLNVVGDYFEVEQFLAELENLPRALRVSNLTLAPGAGPVVQPGATAVSPDDGRTLTSTIIGSVFMAAGRPPATPVVAPVVTPAK
ncbi:MAG: type 4a pilus biogenesis protein PilO [Frankiales bacterium]|nr:type 4a pilus biogenesis protein PilO [Frankiales bacterium]